VSGLMRVTPLPTMFAAAIISFHKLNCSRPHNAQAELRGLMVSRRAAVSSSLWLDRAKYISLLIIG
jgi:hypothetical protein